MIKRTSADAAFSDCVRLRAHWKCERCGKMPEDKGLHCAHVFSRGNWSTRFDPSNALSLCYGCHRYLDGHRSERMQLAIAMRGEDQIRRLELLHKQPAKGVKNSLKEIAKWYRKEHKEMLEIAATGITYKIQFNRWEGL